MCCPAGHAGQRAVHHLDSSVGRQDHNAVGAVLDDGVEPLFFGRGLLVEAQIAHGNRSLVGEALQHLALVGAKGQPAAPEDVDRAQRFILDPQGQLHDLAQGNTGCR